MLMLAMDAARADLSVNTTRLVYQESGPPSLMRVRNVGGAPSLVQVWIDNGRNDVPLEKLQSPFVVSTPLFRLSQGGSRDIVMRGVATQALPTDRESLFWLNILDVPATERNVSMMDIAIRIRMKIFYRPHGLAGEPGQVVQKLHWRIHKGAGGMNLLASNPTPYHINLRGVKLNGRELDIAADAMVIAPFSEWRHAIETERAAPSGDDRLIVGWIDDDGVTEEHAVQIGR